MARSGGSGRLPGACGGGARNRDPSPTPIWRRYSRVRPGRATSPTRLPGKAGCIGRRSSPGECAGYSATASAIACRTIWRGMLCVTPADSSRRSWARYFTQTAPVNTPDASDDFRGALAALDMVASMSRKGICRHNAVSESFFATLRAEQATGPYAAKHNARRAIAAYIHGFYNPLRLHSSAGHLSPNEFARRMKHVDQSPSMRPAA